MKKLQKIDNVSHETLLQLERYNESLHEWQAKMNLVSQSSLADSWNRHIIDSMRLFRHIPPAAKTLLDLGSGAGFPGMVLAIMAKAETPYLKVTLVESIRKKTLYLNHVAELTNTPVRIINDRIESLKGEKTDVITSRALASLDKLLGYAKPLMNGDSKCLFLKGVKYAEEIAEAKKKWLFDCEVVEGESEGQGVILKIGKVRGKS